MARASIVGKVSSRPLRSGDFDCEALKRLQSGAACDQSVGVALPRMRVVLPLLSENVGLTLTSLPACSLCDSVV